jgi:hypothetical protein
MKTITLVVLLVVSLVLGSLCLTQNRKASEAEARAAALAQNVAALEERLAQQETRATTLQSRLQDTRAKVVARADEVAQLEQVLTNRAETNGKSSNPFGEMFKNPEMKELIKTQQKTVFSGMIDKNYASLFSALNLTPQQSASLKDLIMKKTMVDAETGMSMMSSDLDATQRADAVKQSKADKDAINEEIKQALGQDGYAQFQTYEKSIPERMALSTFKDQQAAGATPLNADQESQLVQALTEERQNFKFTTDFYDQSKLTDDLASNFTEEKLTQFQREREQLDQNYLSRASNILSPDQLGPFEKFLSDQGKMQNAAMKMAAQMFGSKAGGN